MDEALRYWGYCAHNCIIDNTNLAILSGSGSSARIHPEMVAFANNYGFEWKAHALGHANRKAGKERNFYTIETNLFPGRRFNSLEDFNAQAITWATQRYARRPQAKTKLIPIELFEVEKSALVKLPDFISAPYLEYKRIIDQYGHCCFDGNYYWVPPSARLRQVTVLQYSTYIRIMDGLQELIRYDIAADGLKNAIIVPPGHRTTVSGPPRNRKLTYEHEEKRLRELGETVGVYLDRVKSSESMVVHRGAFIRKLYTLFRQMGETIFRQAIHRALDYQVYDYAAVERIAEQIVRTAIPPTILPPDVDEQYRNRDTYREGQFSDENDIDYDQ
jgi:hypothetical protein